MEKNNKEGNISDISENEVKENILKVTDNRDMETGISKIGENRGQLFVRIPRNITQELGLKKGQSLKFTVKTKPGRQKIEVTVEE